MSGTDSNRLKEKREIGCGLKHLDCPKVFIVEDDKSIRETFEEALKSEGFEVETFADGQKAIDRLKTSPEPCLVLLDMLMPVMNGEEFMNHFHQLPATILPIPVFLVSATSSSAVALKLGCSGFMKKPVDLEALLIIVHTYCKSHKIGHAS
jgi:CheY-like chemotaxis protein